jgi:putative endonuclease
MPPGPPYYVYVLGNRRRTVFYVGMTNGLRRRLREHRRGHSSFTKQYNVTELLYFERYDSPKTAVERERQLKRWRREKKEAFIRSANPSLDALPPPVE